MREFYRSKARAEASAKKKSNHTVRYVVFPNEDGTWYLVRCRMDQARNVQAQAFFAEREMAHTGRIRLHQTRRRRVTVRWTPEEVQSLKRMRIDENKGWADIAKALNRRYSSVVQKFRSLDLPSNYKAWSDEEVADLKELKLEGRGWSEIARIMGRDRRSVVNKYRVIVAKSCRAIRTGQE